MIQNIEGTIIKVKIEDEQFELPQETRTKQKCFGINVKMGLIYGMEK